MAHGVPVLHSSGCRTRLPVAVAIPMSAHVPKYFFRHLEVQIAVCGIVAHYIVVVSNLLKVRMSLCGLLALSEPHVLVGLSVEVKMAVDVRKAIVLVTVHIDFCDGVIRDVGYKKCCPVALFFIDGINKSITSVALLKLAIAEAKESAFVVRVNEANSEPGRNALVRITYIGIAICAVYVPDDYILPEILCAAVVDIVLKQLSKTLPVL